MENVVRFGTALVFVLSAEIIAAQTTAFNFQGSLTDEGSPADGSYQMQFKIFDSPVGGAQIGSTIADLNVTAANGIFGVQLDFGAGVFPGAARFLEIGVRSNVNDSYSILVPRHQINSSPYAVRAISAQQADLALDSQKLGGIDASGYVTDSTFDITGNGIFGGRVGIGTNDPAAGLHISGTGVISQERITDTASGNSLVLQGGAGSNMKVTGYNYNTASAVPLYLSVDGANTILNNGGGNVGIGTSVPSFRLDVVGSGGVRSLNSSASHFVAETNGGTNTWARFYMRSPNRSWFIGTSQNFNGDQLYFSDETAGQTRMAISTGGFVGINNTAPLVGLDIRGTGLQVQQRITDNTSGNSLVLQAGASDNMKVTGYNYGGSTPVPLYLSTDGANTVMNNGGGNVLQPGAGFGLPKAMIFVLANGTISRCYNGVTGASSSGCGFSVILSGGSNYNINFGFSVTGRFFSAINHGSDASDTAIKVLGVEVNGTLDVRTFSTPTGDDLVSDFFLIVY